MHLSPIDAAALSWSDARRVAYAAGAPLPSERVSVSAALGRWLAADVLASCDMPRFATAAMDGFAIAAGESWRVVDEVGAAAGHPWDGVLKPGEAIPVATGACVPAGAESVLPIEDVVVAGGCVMLADGLAASTLGKHIRRPGEDAWAGDVLAVAGTRVGPAMAGLAASFGLASLPVRRTPTVAVIVTGDELLARGPGAVNDALSPMLPSLIAGFGGEATIARVGDDVPLGDLISSATADVVVVTGSTSVGRGDQLRPALRAFGATLHVDGVACRPGHPMLLAEVDGRFVVGLPGNPYAAFVAAHTLLAPLLRALCGGELSVLPQARMVGGLDARRRAETRIVPVRWSQGGEAVEPCPGHGAAFLRGAASADALAIVRPGGGDAVRLLVL
jgi:molybdopterin molybdotransferase